MKALVIGSGGREHALAWKLAQSPDVATVFVATGNAGTGAELRVRNVPTTKIDELIELAQREQVAFTLVGPEAPLAAGIVDSFRSAGLKIFGPTRAAAQLESSKDFAKAFMRRHKIPTAEYQTFTSARLARSYIDAREAPIVIKADGLASGKGVVVAQSKEEAYDAVDELLVAKKLGAAGTKVIVEDFLEGEEASFIVMVDGKNVLPLASSQDHKRLKDNDQGPNTGGMGAYSPAPVVNPSVHARIMREIILPTVHGMLADGISYTGFLYAGVMIDEEGVPRVLEYNCRLGDPETQPIVLRLKSDLVELIHHALAGTLDQVEAQWDRRAALGIVLAAEGYPDNPSKGARIEGLFNATEDCKVFHAATMEQDHEVVVDGGRVLCITALGDTVRIAQRRAYQALSNIRFDGMQFRRDIGHRAVKTPKS